MKGINKSSRILVMVLIVSMLLPLFPQGIIKAEAKEITYIDYRDLLDLYREQYNVEFDTPTPKFELKIENGKTHFIAPT